MDNTKIQFHNPEIEKQSYVIQTIYCLHATRYVVSRTPLVKLTIIIMMLDDSGGVNKAVRKFYNIDLTAVSKFQP